MQTPERDRWGDPFSTPKADRTPSRRFRGRLVAPVTVWTAGSISDDAGLTVSSLVVAEGDPSHVLGLVSDTTELWEAIDRTRRFVVHVLREGDAALAELFARRRPYSGTTYDDLSVVESPYGPVIETMDTRADCRVEGISRTGFHDLIDGVVDNLVLGERTSRPLVHFRGEYRRLAPGH